MRIAFIVNSYPPRLGGLESHIYHLSVSLAQLGHEVFVLTISDKPGHRQEEGVDIRTDRRHFPVADIISFPALGATRAIAHFLREHHIDVVSVHTRFFPMSFVGVRSAHKAGIPAIHTEHGSGFVASSSPIIAPASRAVDVTMGRYVLRHEARVPCAVWSHSIPSFRCQVECLSQPWRSVKLERLTRPSLPSVFFQ